MNWLIVMVKPQDVMNEVVKMKVWFDITKVNVVTDRLFHLLTVLTASFLVL